MSKEIFKELMEGLDLTELKELQGFGGRYLIDIKNAKIFDTLTCNYKKNTINAKGYIYHRLNKDDGTSEVLSLHRIVMRAALEVDHDFWRRFNLVVDHRNGAAFDCRFENLQLLTQSENLKKRKSIKKAKRFTQDELDALNKEFEQLEAKHGELNAIYEQLAKKYSCAAITIQNRYLAFKKTT